jgi:hypothetical protein
MILGQGNYTKLTRTAIIFTFEPKACQGFIDISASRSSGSRNDLRPTSEEEDYFRRTKPEDLNPPLFPFYTYQFTASMGSIIFKSSKSPRLAYCFCDGLSL